MKHFSIIFALFFSITAFSATGFILPQNPDSLTNSSNSISFIVNGTVGNFKIIANSASRSDTSGFVSGNGQKSMRIIGLPDGTNQTWTISILSAKTDTLTGTANFTTLATPVTPGLLVTYVAPNKLKITGSTNHPMFVYVMYGTGMNYSNQSATFFAKAGTVNDSVILPAVTLPNTQYDYIVLSYGAKYVTGGASGLNIRYGNSLTTPAVMFSRITGNTPTVYLDSARISLNLTIGNQAATATVVMTIYDSTGMVTGSVVIPNQKTGLIGNTFTGLNQNSPYTYKGYCLEGVVRTDSVSGNFRTLTPAPKVKKPNLTTLYWTGGAEVSCGEIKLMNLMIIMPSVTDTVDIFIYKQNMTTGFISIVKSLFGVNKSINTGPISDKQVVGSTDYAYWVESWNKDSSESDSEPWFEKTQTGIAPDFKNDPPQIVTSNSVTIPISGDGGCSIGKGINFYELLPGGTKKLLTMSAPFTPSATQFSGSVTIVGLTPCSNYSIVGVFDNGIGPVSGEILKFKTTGCQTSGLTNLEEVWNNGQVEAYDLTGRLVASDEMSELQLNLSGRGVFILRVLNPETGIYTSKKQNF